MFSLSFLTTFATFFLSFLGIVGVVSGAFVAVRAVSMKGGIEALRTEITVLRADFNEVKARLIVVETERDGLKRDAAVHFEARLLVLEENRALRAENRELLTKLAAL